MNLIKNIRFQELVKGDKREISSLRRELIKHLASAPIFFFLPTWLKMISGLKTIEFEYLQQKEENRIIDIWN